LRWRAALDGKRYLTGELSYADITMAVVVQFLRPVRGPLLPLGDATRRLWTDEELAREFEDLIAWRDALYEERAALGARALSLTP
jgi:glutathione S-transferase